MEMEINMNDIENKNLPWQYFPKKFIQFASQFKTTNDEFERLIAYLMLDVGVETLCKVYLLMTNSDTIKYKKREEIANGTISKNIIPDSGITAADFDTANFHILVENVKRLSDSKINDEDIKKAEYFHKLRNNIYHQGVKSAPPKKDFEEYLSLANSLLDTLLGVNNTAQKINLGIDEMGAFISESFKKESYKNLETKIAIATEILHPKYAARTLEVKIEELQYLYDEENVRESQEEIIKGFNAAIGKEFDDFNFINECVHDITYLRLIALGSKIDIDKNEIDKYLEYRRWTQASVKSEDEFTPEYIAKVNDHITWGEKFAKKIDALIEHHVKQ